MGREACGGAPPSSAVQPEEEPSSVESKLKALRRQDAEARKTERHRASVPESQQICEGDHPEPLGQALPSSAGFACKPALHGLPTLLSGVGCRGGRVLPER